jgi:energy-coupling factor transporter ATP-binding protein EcfA2
MVNKVKMEPAADEGQDDTLPRPAYFLSLSVENVRCFGPRQTLDLSDRNGLPAQWTIILGNNGVGKTTLLQSLISVCPERYGTSSLAPIYRLEWNLSRGKGGENKLLLSPAFLVGRKLTGKGNGEVFNEFKVTGYRDSFKNDAYIAALCPLQEFPFFGYGASRRMGDTSLSQEDEDSPFASLFSEDVKLLNAEEWLLQADYAAHAANNEVAVKRAEKRRDEIREVLLKLLPEIEDIRFVPFTYRRFKPGVEVKTPYGWVSLKDLSLGYKTLIAWMVDFASRMFDRYPESPNPLAEPAVVLVDEIDLHLHPKWQRTLMGYLSERFPNTQFIATAHSPLVVQAAQDANIVLLRREGDHVVIENNVEAVRNWRVDQILTSDLFGLESARPPETDKLLAERTKILSKARLTKKDREKLKELEEKIGSLPTGETPEDIEAMEVIRRAAKRLKAEGY